MSWEVVREREYACPCGKGSYTVESLMDDWNRHDESWTMHCSECQANYVLDTCSGTDRDGISFTNHPWLLRTTWMEREARRQRIADLKRATMHLLSERYGEQWAASFSALRSKKAQWQVLTDLGLRPGSLGTYYRHGSDYMDYLRNEFYFENTPTVLAHLGVQDEEVLSNMRTVRQLQDLGA